MVEEVIWSTTKDKRIVIDSLAVDSLERVRCLSSLYEYYHFIISSTVQLFSHHLLMFTEPADFVVVFVLEHKYLLNRSHGWVNMI